MNKKQSITIYMCIILRNSATFFTDILLSIKLNNCVCYETISYNIYFLY